MPRPFLVGTNVKMTQTAADSARFYDELAGGTAPPGVQRFVIPPFTSLDAVARRKRAADGDIWVGAQTMHWAAEGAYTGEISAPMLRALDVDLVLLGHAERRAQFHETDEVVNRKLLAAASAGFRVLLCLGETAAEKGYGVGPETVARQLKIGLHDLDPAALPRLQIAYEPVWSIGAEGKPARPADVAPTAAHLRALMRDRFGPVGGEVPILYGGSVDPTNAADFARLPDIGGLFVGRAAWTVDGFRAVVAAAVSGRNDPGTA